MIPEIEFVESPWYPGKYFIQQNYGLSCFLWAVANFSIFKGYKLPDSENFNKSKEIGICQHGSCIGHSELVEYFGVYRELEKCNNPKTVLDNGGIIFIWHPISNGHALFTFPKDDNSIYLINSWLGPVVISTLKERVEQFLPENQNILMDNPWRIKY